VRFLAPRAVVSAHAPHIRSKRLPTPDGCDKFLTSTRYWRHVGAILSHLTWLGYSIQGDHGLLFGMAIISFLSCATVFIHRDEIPFVTPLSYW
jgi:hypothetical protein